MDNILVDADLVVFEPMFGAAMVAVRPGMLKGSGAVTLNGVRVCVAGDEASVRVNGCLYSSGLFSIPGTGSLEVASLSSAQRTSSTQVAGQQLLVVGRMFTARFRVENPAQQPSTAGPIPDPMAEYTGKGRFLSANRFVRAR